MEKLKVNIFIKKLLLKKPKNIIYTKKNVFKYEAVINKFKEFKLNKKYFDYEICGIFDYFIEKNNHILMYHSANNENSLLIVKFENDFYFYKLPYLIINNKVDKLNNTNFIAYYN